MCGCWEERPLRVSGCREASGFRVPRSTAKILTLRCQNGITRIAPKPMSWTTVLKPFRHVGPLEGAQLFDQQGWLRVDADRVPVSRGKKFGLDHVVDESQERREEASDVEQPDRLVDLRQLIHGPDFHH